MSTSNWLTPTGPSYTPIYDYAPLPNAKTHIRILTIDLDNDELSGSLKDYTVAKAPPYEALSYTWGDQLPTFSLICDGARLFVSPYLHTCIQHLRTRAQSLTGKPRRQAQHFWRRSSRKMRVWIDAICINQKDDVEKAEQIPLMAQIYSSAERTLTWLGLADDGSDEALLSIDSLSRKLLNLDQGIYLYSQDFAQAGLPLVSDPIWFYLAEFWSRPWFRRLWIVQEAVLGRDILFICGEQTIGFDQLLKFVDLLDEIGIATRIIRKARSLKHAEEGRHCILQLAEFRENWGHPEPHGALNMLEVARRREVTEPVDRIYGVLGIVDRCYQENLVVNYTAKAREEYWIFYTSLAKFQVQRYGLRFLNHAESHARPKLLPTWVPNWNTDQPTWPVSDHFYAGGQPQKLAHEAFSPDSTSIQLCGMHVGIIAAVSTLYYEMFDSEIWADQAAKGARRLESITHALNLYRQLPPIDGHDRSLLAFARTLIADTRWIPHPGQTVRYDQDALQDFQFLMQYLKWSGQESEGPTTRPSEEDFSNNIDPYHKYLHATLQHRSFFITDDGQIGLASQSSRPGDKVVVLLGAHTPFVLREVEGRDSFTLICDAYVDGIMYGESLERDESERRIYVID